MALFPAGCLKLVDTDGRMVGYGLSHPWHADAVAPLDTLHGRFPGPGADLYLHDVALLPEGRGRNASGRYVAAMRRVAAENGLRRLALTSVYGTVPLWRRHGFTLRDGAAIRAGLLSYGPDARYMVLTLKSRNDGA